VNFARQAASLATNILVIVVRDAGSVLVHAYDGSIDHLHRRIMTGSELFHRRTTAMQRRRDNDEYGHQTLARSARLAAAP
jgi:hypothetical protein